MSRYLEVRLHEQPIGVLTLLPGDRAFFAFDEPYLNDADRPVLSQSFFRSSGELVAVTRTTQTRLPAFFSNLLPEGHLGQYLARQGGIKPEREFLLLELLGEDLPGTVSVQTLPETPTPPEPEADTRTPALAPAYDLVSTIPYMPDDRLALTLGDTKEMQAITLEHFRKLVRKAQVPSHIVLATVKDTVAATLSAWQVHHRHYPLPDEMAVRIGKHMQSVRLAKG